MLRTPEFVTTDKVTMKLDRGCLMIRLVFRAKIGVCLVVVGGVQLTL